jgi:protein-S-isoprenylcysteine O-methyltransferase Ste14
MPLLALAGYAVFLALAFGLRAIVHHRRTGTTGFVGLGGRPGSIEWCAGLLFAVALVGGAAAPVAQLAGFLEPWDGRRSDAIHAIGAVLAIVGIGGTLWAQLAMGDSWRVGVDMGARTELVVASGPFRWVRNPIFSWMTLASAGLVLLSPNALAVASFAALLVALEIQVRAVEEPYLMRTHGDAYRRYAASTGRFVPGVGRLEAR